MRLRYVGLAPLFELSDDALAARGIQRMVAHEKPGFPCRVTLEDAEPGERVLLLAFEHQPAHSPYRASGPIFVREKAQAAFDAVNELPPVFDGRLLSARAYDSRGIMRDADIAEGRAIVPILERFFACSDTAYVHVHNARRGCFAARVERA